MPKQSTLPRRVHEDLRAAGFYPQMAADVMGDLLFDEDVLSHVVHVDTHFDMDTIHRHITVLMLTGTRLLLSHIDDDAPGPDGVSRARATTEDIELHRLETVLIGQTFSDPAQYRPGQPPAEVNLTLAWGALTRLDTYPESCGDPECEGDHGYGGTMTREDLSLRVSALADGQDAADRALAFARTLRHAVFLARRNRR